MVYGQIPAEVELPKLVRPIELVRLIHKVLVSLSELVVRRLREEILIRFL